MTPEAGPNVDPDEHVSTDVSHKIEGDQPQKAEEGRLDANDESEMHNYRVLSQYAAIDGKAYHEADGKGGYGEVRLSGDYVKRLQDHGIRLVCLDDEEAKPEDDRSYSDK